MSEDYLEKAMALITIWKSSKNYEGKATYFTEASTYLLLDIAKSLRDISSGIHSLDIKTP